MIFIIFLYFHSETSGEVDQQFSRSAPSRFGARGKNDHGERVKHNIYVFQVV